MLRVLQWSANYSYMHVWMLPHLIFASHWADAAPPADRHPPSLWQRAAMDGSVLCGQQHGSGESKTHSRFAKPSFPMVLHVQPGGAVRAAILGAQVVQLVQAF